MSNAPLPDTSSELFDCQWEHMWGQLAQEWSIRDQVSTTLKEASATFAAQVTEPDASKYMEACDRLATFLDLNIPLEQSEQKLLVQVLQVACAVHENVINNSTFTKAQRSAFHLASTSLYQLCQSALSGSITYTSLWCDGFSINCRAEKALNNATEALDLSKYLDSANTSFGGTSAAPSPTPTVSGAPTPRGLLHDTADVRETPRSTKIKEQALAMLNDRTLSKAKALGRAHTMPALSQSQSTSTSGTHSSRAGRTPLKASSRGVLQALQEIEE